MRCAYRLVVMTYEKEKHKKGEGIAFPSLSDDFS